MRDPATKAEWLEGLRAPRKTLVPYWALGMAVLVGAVLAGVLYSGRLLAEETLPRPTTVLDLYAQAMKIGGYELKCQFRRGGCPAPVVAVSAIESDNVAGQFDPRMPNFVTINSKVLTPGTLDWNATVVHEFVHYLQWVFGEIGPAVSCEDVAKAEVAAYKASAEYLSQFGIVRDHSMQLFAVAVMCLEG